MKPTTTFPRRLAGSSREWKQIKRRQVKAVLQAVEQLRYGIAFTPVSDVDRDVSWDALEASLKKIESLLSYKNWGR